LDSGTGSFDSAKQLEFIVSPNYPNPFRLGTTIDYVLPKQSFVEIGIYDASGLRIRTLVSEPENAGTHRVMWDGKDHWGQAVTNGSYYYLVDTGDFHVTKRMQRVNQE
jgi:flagellar hook assembly protein FlgD